MRDNSYGGDVNTERGFFEALWRTRTRSPVSHSPEIWDDRANEWIEDLGDDGEGKSGMRERVDATARELRARGLLGKNDTVVDVGCGPGLFVAEFAKTAKSAVGIDYSAKFVDYATDYVRSRGIENAAFARHDFFELDIERAGLARAFDLVFTSITPAASGDGCLEKLMRMSRGYCYNASFVHASDTLAERVSREVFDESFRPRWDGMGFYALVNLLWLSGYYPETFYFDDVRVETLPPSERLAATCTRVCGHDSDADRARVYDYLRTLGDDIERTSAFRYGSILWDVNRKDNRG
jgi:SAM-dependent methyltransferase